MSDVLLWRSAKTHNVENFTTLRAGTVVIVCAFFFSGTPREAAKDAESITEFNVCHRRLPTSLTSSILSQLSPLGRPLVDHWGVRHFAPPGVWQGHTLFRKDRGAANTEVFLVCFRRAQTNNMNTQLAWPGLAFTGTAFFLQPPEISGTAVCFLLWKAPDGTSRCFFRTFRIAQMRVLMFLGLNIPGSFTHNFFRHGLRCTPPSRSPQWSTSGRPNLSTSGETHSLRISDVKSWPSVSHTLSLQIPAQ